MKKSTRFVFHFHLLLATLFFACGSAWALPWRQVPDPRVNRGSFVQDSAGILGAAESEKLDGICKNLEAKTTIELAVVTVDSLEGLTVEEYATELFRRLGIGKKGKDNGVLVLFSEQDRKVRLEVGYGLEETLTDARSRQLLDEFAIPQFKSRRYPQGLIDLTAAVSETLGGDKVARAAPRGLSAEETAQIDREIELIKQREHETRNARIEALLREHLPQWIGYFLGLIALLVGLSLVLALSQGLSKARASKLERLRKLKKVAAVVMVVAFFALPISVVFGLIAWIYPIFIVLPFLGIGLIPIYKILKRRALNYRLPCPQCAAKMEIVPEYQDDKWLSDEEVDEEIAKGMDYEFWSCPQCTALQRFNVKLGGASACPQCRRRSLVEISKVLRAATTSSSGLRLRQDDCKNRSCDYFKEWHEVIPQRSSSSGGGGFSSSSSSSSSFGGGRSGGGGASGSW